MYCTIVQPKVNFYQEFLINTEVPQIPSYSLESVVPNVLNTKKVLNLN